MHDTAMAHGKLFFDTYLKDAAGLKILDIGAQDVNGSLRSVAPANCEYIGLDFQAGKGVDKILTDPYSLPYSDNYADACVSSSCFEHSEFFWLTFLEIVRVLKPSGLLYLNVPSNGHFHRYPVDCWRFYPDSGIALQNWARRNGYSTALLESFIGNQQSNGWNDFVGIFVKDEKTADLHERRIQHSYRDYTNGREFKSEDISNFRVTQEDQLALSRRAKGKLIRMLQIFR